MYVGRAVGFIRQQRDKAFSSSRQKAEMQAMQAQLSEAMSQLQYIRHDIRSSARPHGLQPQAQATSSQVPPQEESTDPSAAGSVRPPASNPDVDVATANHHAFPAPADPVAAPWPVHVGAGGEKEEHGAHVLSPARLRFHQISTECDEGRTVYVAGVPLVPVNAAAAGQSGTSKRHSGTGSFLAEEALIEQQVASQAHAFLGGRADLKS